MRSLDGTVRRAVGLAAKASLAGLLLAATVACDPTTVAPSAGPGTSSAGVAPGGVVPGGTALPAATGTQRPARPLPPHTATAAAPVTSTSTATATSAGAATVPVLGASWAPHQQGYGQARPATVFNGGDPTGLVEHLTWSSWGGSSATGTGTAEYVGPGQSVATGTPEKAEVVAFDLGTCSGRTAYRAVEWYFPDHGQHFAAARYLDACTGTDHGM
ncbi:hypothetical protein P3T36_004213 [Kitasatospora sp. MAP12-15]|uniref:hypothetical protein n=1 Tax=unclassified Kitasatospora TaxID=2633591 RepID=UPI002474125A|nr:hypothetical protein [Kitasatospora sp. MAP12-44]MDH6108322.1 hypothetical protein [Kitasatospora sp. MAP12-44]